MNLESLNAKLSRGGSLGKALSLLGRQLDVDLDWALEAINEKNDEDENCNGGDDKSDGVNDSDDDDYEDTSENDCVSDQDVDTLREWSRKMLHLEAIEQQKARDATKDKTSAAGMEHSVKQIFDTKAAFRRLLNELEEIFKAPDIHLMVDAPGPEGLFQWEVYLAGFSTEKSDLATDLYQTGRHFGLSSVHLQITFKRGLHPFYPPSIQVLSPRFVGPVLGAVSCFPMLHPQNWDPIASAKDIILNIKDFLEENARVNLESSTQNYHQTELSVSRLSALTGIQPVDPAVSPDSIYSCDPHRMQIICGGYSNNPATGNIKERQPPPVSVKTEVHFDKNTYEYPSASSKKLRAGFYPPPMSSAPAPTVAPPTLETEEGLEAATTEPEKPEQLSRSTENEDVPVAWNKGVGYGSGTNSKNKNKQVWDAKRAEALQDARDAELYQVLSSIAEAAKKAFIYTNNLEAEMKESMKIDESLPQYDRGEQCIVIAALITGCLVPFLIKELFSAGFQGMASRPAYYRALLECVHVLCLHPETAPMLCWHAEDDLKSLATAVSSLKMQVSTFLRALGDQPTTSEPEDDYTLATLVLNVAKQIAETMDASAVAPSAAAAAAVTDGAGPSKTITITTTDVNMAPALTSEEESEAHYVSIMSPFKVALVPGIAINHLYKAEASMEPTVASRHRARRVASELASLESDLPINASSSVFVCADEQQTVLWKALITGPKGTPYESGCFLFDIYFTSSYPVKAPSVKLRTTGGGTVRLNPNLYNTGKVCLSLLGTWSGEQGESWSAEYSSILQVLISIQSLIFVDQPFYNEPGYESWPDENASNTYSANIMAHTVKWAMLDQLQSPPEYFAEAIKSHFRERGEVVLATVKRWENWCTEIGAGTSAAVIKEMLPELENEISKLKVA